jgi:hypothetical protein
MATDPEGTKRKERVIHTRVPRSLDDEIRRKAGNLGLSVSNLVRNVLENAFGLVEDIVYDSAEIARSARGDGPAGRRAGADARGPVQILGWTVALLNVNAVCNRCNAMLPKGTRAGIGVVEGGAPTPFRCQSCLEELAHDDVSNEK